MEKQKEVFSETIEDIQYYYEEKLFKKDEEITQLKQQN